MIAVVLIAGLVAPGLSLALLGNRRALGWWAAGLVALVLIAASIWALVALVALAIGGTLDAGIAYARGAKLAKRWTAPVVIAVGWIAATLVARLVLVGAYKIPASSMQPTLAIGDHLMITKLARTPARGELVVFAQPCSPERDYVKRVVAIPGDRIEIRCDVVYVNGAALPRVAVAGYCPYADTIDGSDVPRACRAFRETLDGRSYVVLEAPGVGERDFPVLDAPSYMQCDQPVELPPPVHGATGCAPQRAVVVPAGSYFVVGDNRGNSNDSRQWGMVRASDIRGTVVGRWWPWQHVGAVR